MTEKKSKAQRPRRSASKTSHRSRILQFKKKANARALLKKTALSPAELEKEFNRLLTIVVHDLHEPLLTISLYLNLLKMQYGDKLPPRATEFLDFSLDGAGNMKNLLQAVSAYSRATSRTSSLKRTNLDAVLEEALRSLQGPLELSEASIEKTPLPELVCDEMQMTQVFKNLISNAMKFKSQKEPWIQIGAKKQKKEWIFWVKDNGIGFEPKYSAEIFSLFRRLHSREEYSGTGTGLTICEKIIRQHKGRIWAESELGKGSTFFFSLPAHLK